jgi:opacity protein-like surface antigen
MLYRAATTILAIALPAVWLISACSAGASDEAATSSTPSSSSAGKGDAGSGKPSTPKSNQSNDGSVTLEIVLAGDEVTPTGKQVEVRVGQRVQLRVDSDVTDELHVHSAPAEQLFEISADDDQRVQLVPQQPGQFDVEVHSSGTLVAQLVVRP